MPFQRSTNRLLDCSLSFTVLHFNISRNSRRFSLGSLLKHSLQKRFATLLNRLRQLMAVSFLFFLAKDML
jgi:hypothetical protein